VLVVTKAEIKATEEAASALLATVEPDVVLELVSPVNKGGWVKIKHKDGITGYMQASAVWGLN
jgi:SH3-like domain-containing protein